MNYIVLGIIMNEKNIILKLIDNTRKHLNEIHLFMILTVKEYTSNYKDYLENSISTEFFSMNELEELLDAVHNFGIYTTVYYDTYDFIKDSFNMQINKYDVLFDTTQKGVGKGKDALMPTWCDIINLSHTGSNAVFNVITNDKYCWSKFLEAHGIPIPPSWKYSNVSKTFVTTPPINGQKMICKPIYECASIGIDRHSIGTISPEYIDMLQLKSDIYSQPLIVQEFICGYEVEVPVISTKYGNIILPPVGISIDGETDLDNRFLGFDAVYDDKYGFYNFSEVFPELSEHIKQISYKIVNLIDFNGYGRIDFRVDKQNLQIYVTDINAYPHIVQHSSFAKSFEILGITPTHVIPALVGNVI